MSLDQHPAHTNSQPGSMTTADALFTHTDDDRKNSEVIRTLVKLMASPVHVVISLVCNSCFDIRFTIRSCDTRLLSNSWCA